MFALAFAGSANNDNHGGGQDERERVWEFNWYGLLYADLERL